VDDIPEEVMNHIAKLTADLLQANEQVITYLIFFLRFKKKKKERPSLPHLLQANVQVITLLAVLVQR
jgi:heme/copper-type cytochrome/quinol oxidase subunit 4